MVQKKKITKASQLQFNTKTMNPVAKAYHKFFMQVDAMVRKLPKRPKGDPSQLFLYMGFNPGDGKVRVTEMAKCKFIFRMDRVQELNMGVLQTIVADYNN